MLRKPMKTSSKKEQKHLKPSIKRAYLSRRGCPRSLSCSMKILSRRYSVTMRTKLGSSTWSKAKRSSPNLSNKVERRFKTTWTNKCKRNTSNLQKIIRKWLPQNTTGTIRKLLMSTFNKINRKCRTNWMLTSRKAMLPLRMGSKTSIRIWKLISRTNFLKTSNKSKAS